VSLSRTVLLRRQQGGAAPAGKPTRAGGGSVPLLGELLERRLLAFRQFQRRRRQDAGCRGDLIGQGLRK
jgi:hypothetical protein